ncbi:MAG: bifunctional (p)ppGpp synthetase/guanosine-3',5'-bis(diphosphate) 3'-pyrophosphohydrolase [Alphaproteobacteria bacterium]|nr:bifunctional (p)ppGpp synthetase/guanosine-3',5'-bis(diphosphate) 3'-pyrophosphohydrolase [Alphaproteobacteria bacterium]
MMRQYELVDRVRRYNAHVNEDLLNRAYVYAMKAHGAQKRASGDPYFTHPLEVAAILTDLHLDDATIAAAILHDTVEDTGSTLEDIGQLFGVEISRLVDGLTKIKKFDLVSKQAAQGENFRKLLLAIADDVRVLLVKLADRLHNMRTLGFVSDEKRKRIAQETLDIYAPLAGRMGMQGLRDELEDLSFRTIMPDAYAMIETRLKSLRSRSGETIARIERELTEELSRRGIAASVSGREKQPYSIWRKMERKSIAFEQLSDIFGFRVVVGSIEDCYRVIGVVHTKWPTVPDRFKDYISTPKQNDYRSIHTTVIGPGRQRVELQVRTQEMEDVADFGIAAHAAYKEGRGGDMEAMSRESLSFQWLRHTIDLLAEGDNPEEFLEHTKLEMFLDQVFCFTPKGRLIALPRGATPIDFAYAVHTDVGNRAVGSKINGRIAPLLSPLQNGDEVEILVAEGHSPPAAWESLAVTGKARAAIRRATREAIRTQYAELGRQIVTRAFERAGKPYAENEIRAVLPRLARSTLEDVLAAVGRGEMVSGDVVKAVHPEFVPERSAGAAPRKGESGWFGLKKAASLVFRVPDAGRDTSPHAIPIRGLQGDLPVSFAPNGGAVPGDRIVGILTPGEGITVYPIQSPALTAFDDQPDRWLDVRWDIDENDGQLFPARIRVSAINEPGSLGVIATMIGDSGANIDHVDFINRSPDVRDVVLDIEVRDLKHLSAIVSRLKANRVITRVERVNG